MLYLESLGAAYGQRSRRDRAPFCVPNAILGAPDAAFVWQVQYLERLGATCGQRSPRDRAYFCMAGTALTEPRHYPWLLAYAVPRTFLPGRCSTRCTGTLLWAGPRPLLRARHSIWYSRRYFYVVIVIVSAFGVFFA